MEGGAVGFDGSEVGRKLKEVLGVLKMESVASRRVVRELEGYR